MIIGTTLLKMAGSTYYSPQFSRGGMGAVFTVDVTNWVGGGVSPKLIIGVEHRNLEDTAWTTLVMFADINADGTTSATGGPIKELLRFTYTFTGGVATTGAHVNVLAPQWRPFN